MRKGLQSMLPQSPPAFSQVPPRSQQSTGQFLPMPSKINSLNKNKNNNLFYENLKNISRQHMRDFIKELEYEHGINDDNLDYDDLIRDYYTMREIKPINDQFVESSIIELIEAVKKKILSYIQVKILLLKIRGASHQTITEKYCLSSKPIARKVILRTVCGRKWDRNYKGGGEKVLSDIDEEIFKKNIEERANDIDCISTHVANILVYHLQESRCKKAKAILSICNCSKLAGKIKLRTPNSTWLNKAANNRMGIKIVSKQEIEKERRIACDKTVINQFFDLHSELLNRDPELIFNMDETMVSSKKFKILCPKSSRGLSVADDSYPHITACITICADGHILKPFFILPNKKKIRGLEEFRNNAYFASSTSGWMNKKLFTFWALCFVAEMMIYRFSLPENLKKKRILLIVDGHKSRANFFVAKILDYFGIDILVLPGHTSHLLQPFDVSVAASLKTEFKKLMQQYKISFNVEDGTIFVKQKLKMG